MKSTQSALARAEVNAKAAEFAQFADERRASIGRIHDAVKAAVNAERETLVKCGVEFLAIAKLDVTMDNVAVGIAPSGPGLRVPKGAGAGTGNGFKYLPNANSASGDLQFLSELPASLKGTGEHLISEVRRRYPGHLVHYPTGKFVNRPDNFWAVKIQPRVLDLAITVRGYESEFHVPDGIELKKDRGSHSKFKISRPEQVSDAVDIFAQARKK